jgi:hypothetical protein
MSHNIDKAMSNKPKSALEERQHWEELALSVYSELHRNRAYALTNDAKRSLGALAAGWREAGNSFASADNGRDKFAAFLQNEVGPLVLGLFQEQPSDASDPPKPWVDPVTGEQLPNPWLTNDNKAKALLGKRDPALAAHFQAMAKSPYEYVARLQDNAAIAARRKAVKYDAETHETNPFITGNHTEASRLVITDPERAEVYRREAKPLQLPWQTGNRNLTGMGRLAKNPEVRSMVARAENILRIWITEELKFTKSELEQHATEAQRLEAALNGGEKAAHARR